MSEDAWSRSTMAANVAACLVVHKGLSPRNTLELSAMAREAYTPDTSGST